MRAVALTAATAVLALTLTACGEGPGGASAHPAVAVGTMSSIPGYAAPSGEPELGGTRNLSPKPGTIGKIQGVFDDRFTYAGLRFDGKQLTGSVVIHTDVSDILALQVEGAFYDKGGKFLALGHWTYTMTEDNEPTGKPVETMRFTVKVPKKYAGRAAAAGVGVTNLVNE